MAMELMNLAYVSNATTALNSEDLESILKVSRQNNEAEGITGFLMYVEGSFFQFIEGPQLAIDNLYQRLLRDHRHAGLIKMLYQKNDARVFSDWSMAFRRYKSFSNAPIEGYSDFLTAQSNQDAKNQIPLSGKNAKQVQDMILTMRDNCMRTN